MHLFVPAITEGFGLEETLKNLLIPSPLPQTGIISLLRAPSSLQLVPLAVPSVTESLRLGKGSEIQTWHCQTHREGLSLRGQGTRSRAWGDTSVPQRRGGGAQRPGERRQAVGWCAGSLGTGMMGLDLATYPKKKSHFCLHQDRGSWVHPGVSSSVTAVFKSTFTREPSTC